MDYTYQSFLDCEALQGPDSVALRYVVFVVVGLCRLLIEIAAYWQFVLSFGKTEKPICFTL